jgi:hypothetical protein
MYKLCMNIVISKKIPHLSFMPLYSKFMQKKLKDQEKYEL